MVSKVKKSVKIVFLQIVPSVWVYFKKIKYNIINVFFLNLVEKFLRLEVNFYNFEHNIRCQNLVFKSIFINLKSIVSFLVIKSFHVFEVHFYDFEVNFRFLRQFTWLWRLNFGFKWNFIILKCVFIKLELNDILPLNFQDFKINFIFLRQYT